MKASDLTIEQRAEALYRIGASRPPLLIPFQVITHLVMTGEGCAKSDCICHALEREIIREHLNQQRATPSKN